MVLVDYIENFFATTYNAGNPGPGLGKAHKGGCVKPDNGISTLPY
jgi:hypothetical protein